LSAVNFVSFFCVSERFFLFYIVSFRKFVLKNITGY
jgi:hypothetical protein